MKSGENRAGHDGPVHGDGSAPDKPWAKALAAIRAAMVEGSADGVRRAAGELAGFGDAMLSDLAECLLDLRPAPQEAMLSVLFEAVKPSDLLRPTLLRFCRSPWFLTSREERRSSLLSATRVLAAMRRSDGRLDLNVALARVFAETVELSGRTAVATLAVHLRAKSFLHLVTRVLYELLDPAHRKELVDSIAETFQAGSATYLLALYFDPKLKDLKGDIAFALKAVLPADEALVVLLSAAHSESGVDDEAVAANIVSAIVRELPHGFELVRKAWDEAAGTSPRIAILMGLGEEKTRSEIGDFLHQVAQAPGESMIAGTALVNLSRLMTHEPEAARMSINWLLPDGRAGTETAQEAYLKRSFALAALGNLYQRGKFHTEIRDALEAAMLGDRDARIVTECIEFAGEYQLAELRPLIQRLADRPDEKVRAAVRLYLRKD